MSEFIITENTKVLSIQDKDNTTFTLNLNDELVDGDHSFSIIGYSGSDCNLFSNTSTDRTLTLLNGNVIEYPNDITNLTIKILGGGKFKIKWKYADITNGFNPSKFIVFELSGSTIIKLSEVNYFKNSGNYIYNTNSFVEEHGAEKIFAVYPVRTVNGVDYEKLNDLTISGIVDEHGPKVTNVTTNITEI